MSSGHSLPPCRSPSRLAPTRRALSLTIQRVARPACIIRAVKRSPSALVRAGRRRARRIARRHLPPPSTWHLTLPGFDRVLELRWAARVRRAPVMSPEEHAAAFADPKRKHAAIEVPLPCALCGGMRLQELLHVYDHRRAPPRWNYHVVRCAACGFLYRQPGIRPERLGDLYASGKYASFLAGEYTRGRIRRYEVTMAPFGALFESGDGRRLLDFGCGN